MEELIKERAKFIQEKQDLINQLNDIQTKIVRRDGVIGYLTLKINEFKKEE